jgi:hypothetical protein
MQLRVNTNIWSQYIKTTSAECLNIPIPLTAVYFRFCLCCHVSCGVTPNYFCGDRHTAIRPVAGRRWRHGYSLQIRGLSRGVYEVLEQVCEYCNFYLALAVVGPVMRGEARDG